MLSHLHEDHFDRYVTEHLARTTPILTTPHAARSLARMGFSGAYGLPTWKRVRVDGTGGTVTIAAMPGAHAPGILARALPAVMGTLFDFADNAGRRLRMYISGDTLVNERLHEIPARYPDIDIALLHLGGTRVLGLMVTMDGRQGVRAMQIVAPRIAVPIHYDDYDRFRSPLSDFERAVDEAGLRDRVRFLARGQTLALPPSPGSALAAAGVFDAFSDGDADVDAASDGARDDEGPSVRTDPFSR